MCNGRRIVWKDEHIVETSLQPLPPRAEQMESIKQSVSCRQKASAPDSRKRAGGAGLCNGTVGLHGNEGPAGTRDDL